MEFSFFIFLLSLFVIIMFSKIDTCPKTKSKSSFNFPPGPRKIPIIGHLHLLVKSHPPHQILRDLSLKYGPLMHLKFGEISTIVVSSPEAAKQLFKTHDIDFAYRPSLLATEIMCYDNTYIGFAPYGEYWRQLRKICTLELLSVKRVRSFSPIREEEFLNLCRWIASKEGALIDLTERLNFATYEVITRATIGSTSKEQETFISIIKGAIQLASGFYIGDIFPSIKLFGSITGMRQKIERLHKNQDRILETIINNHIASNAAKEKRTDDGTKTQEDLLDVLLKFHEDAGQELPLTTDNVKSVLLDMFSAGSETSATTLDWAMSELLKNPRVMKKAQEEVRKVYEEQGFVNESYLHELTYLKLVIKESLRLHPPVPLLLPRENRKQEVEIDGYKLPLKTRVMVNAWALGRHPKHWKEAESFIPERFQDNSIDFKGNNFEYLPFGAGRRICPGMTFGLAAVELPLAMLLYHFEWVLPDGLKPEEMDMAETLGVVGRRTNHLLVIPVVTKSLPKS